MKSAGMAQAEGASNGEGGDLASSIGEEPRVLDCPFAVLVP